MRSQLIVLVLVCAFVYLALRNRSASRRALMQFWDRRCTGRTWLKAFPSASTDEIRRFLGLFVDAFALPRHRDLKFSPADQVMAVYRSLYPDRGWPDALELETFARGIERTYSIKVGEVWRDDITLGKVCTGGSECSRW